MLRNRIEKLLRVIYESKTNGGTEDEGPCTGRSETEPVMGYRRECLIGSMAGVLFDEEGPEGRAVNRSGWHLGSVRSIVAARAW